MRAGRYFQRDQKSDPLKVRFQLVKESRYGAERRSADNRDGFSGLFGVRQKVDPGGRDGILFEGRRGGISLFIRVTIERSKAFFCHI